MVVTHSLVVTQDLSWTLTVHGKEVNPQMCSALSDTPKTLSTATLQTLLSILDKAAVCPGHPDQQFLSMLDAKKGQLLSRSGHTKFVYILCDTLFPYKCTHLLNWLETCYPCLGWSTCCQRDCVKTHLSLFLASRGLLVAEMKTLHYSSSVTILLRCECNDPLHWNHFVVIAGRDQLTVVP